MMDSQDILEQMELLNTLIDFQIENQAEQSTIGQYVFMRQAFVEELIPLLKEFKLRIPSIDIAA